MQGIPIFPKKLTLFLICVKPEKQTLEFKIRPIKISSQESVTSPALEIHLKENFAELKNFIKQKIALQKKSDSEQDRKKMIKIKKEIKRYA